jgi:hypothetical protein
MELDGILIMHSESGLPLFSRLESHIDDMLFSGLLTAIRSFIKELALGGLSSFSTDEKYFFLTAREKITTCVIAKTNLEFKEVYSLSLEISSKFEEMFNEEISTQIDANRYQEFNKPLDALLDIDKKDIPFIIQVAEFCKKEFGANISFRPKLKNNNQNYVTIDLLIDNGKKTSGLKGKLLTKIHKSFSHDTTFVKVIDGVAGRAEVKDFLELSKTFGGKFSGTNDSEVYNFFPRKMIVVALDYSPAVLEDMKALKRHNDKAVIPATHIIPTAGIHNAPDDMRCYVELWQWKINKYPDRIFF